MLLIEDGRTGGVLVAFSSIWLMTVAAVMLSARAATLPRVNDV